MKTLTFGLAPRRSPPPPFVKRDFPIKQTCRDAIGSGNVADALKGVGRLELRQPKPANPPFAQPSHRRAHPKLGSLTRSCLVDETLSCLSQFEYARAKTVADEVDPLSILPMLSCQAAFKAQRGQYLVHGPDAAQLQAHGTRCHQ